MPSLSQLKQGCFTSLIILSHPLFEAVGNIILAEETFERRCSHGLENSNKDGVLCSTRRILVQLRLGRNRLYACRGVKLRLTMASQMKGDDGSGRKNEDC